MHRSLVRLALAGPGGPPSGASPRPGLRHADLPFNQTIDRLTVSKPKIESAFRPTCAEKRENNDNQTPHPRSFEPAGPVWPFRRGNIIDGPASV